LKPPAGKRQDPFAIGPAEEAIPTASTITTASTTAASQAVTEKETGTSTESEESTTLIFPVATTEQTYGPSSELAPSNQPGKFEKLESKK
jgi:hypothetical protein